MKIVMIPNPNIIIGLVIPSLVCRLKTQIKNITNSPTTKIVTHFFLISLSFGYGCLRYLVTFRIISIKFNVALSLSKIYLHQSEKAIYVKSTLFCIFKNMKILYKNSEENNGAV